MDNYIEKYKEYANSVEGKKNIDDFSKKFDIGMSHVKRLHEKYSNILVEKIIIHYNSKKYLNRYKNGGYPSYTLFYLLYEHAMLYGSELPEKNYVKFKIDSTFVVAVYIYEGYLFSLSVGQGSFILIQKI